MLSPCCRGEDGGCVTGTFLLVSFRLAGALRQVVGHQPRSSSQLSTSSSLSVSRSSSSSAVSPAIFAWVCASGSPKRLPPTQKNVPRFLYAAPGFSFGDSHCLTLLQDGLVRDGFLQLPYSSQ